MTSCSSLIPSEAGRISSLLTSFSLDCKVVTKILNDKMPVTKVPRLGKRKGGAGAEVGLSTMGSIDIMVWQLRAGS